MGGVKLGSPLAIHRSHTAYYIGRMWLVNVEALNDSFQFSSVEAVHCPHHVQPGAKLQCIFINDPWLCMTRGQKGRTDKQFPDTPEFKIYKCFKTFRSTGRALCSAVVC